MNIAFALRSLSRAAARALVAVAGLVALGLGPRDAGAEPLRDPTRPAILPTSTAAPAASAPQGEGGWVLQSVRLGAGNAHAAVISGQLVAAGGRLGDARLVRVTERNAVLEGPGGQTTLWLITDVDKRELPAAAPERKLIAAPRPAASAAPPSGTTATAPLTAPSRIAKVSP